MKRCKNCVLYIVKISLIGFLFGLLFGFILNGEKSEKQKAVNARVAEFYTNKNNQVKFRYLTEYKEDMMEIE